MKSRFLIFYFFMSMLALSACGRPPKPQVSRYFPAESAKENIDKTDFGQRQSESIPRSQEQILIINDWQE